MPIPPSFDLDPSTLTAIAAIEVFAADAGPRPLWEFQYVDPAHALAALEIRQRLRERRGT